MYIPAPWLDSFITRLPESERDAARLVWEQRRGMTVDEVLDEMMERYLSDLVPFLTEEERETAQSVHFAVLPTFKFNAHATKSPGGDHVILLHHALPFTMPPSSATLSGG